MSLEEQVTQGRLAYTNSVAHDVANGTLIIEFERNPEQHSVYGTLRFEQVMGYTSTLDNEEDREDFEAGLLLEDLLGIQEQPFEDTVRYYIKTDTREISFLTSAPPLWSLVSPDRAD